MERRQAETWVCCTGGAGARGRGMGNDESLFLRVAPLTMVLSVSNEVSEGRVTGCLIRAQSWPA